ncbi:hypothetical protein ACPA9J_32340 [Pseudomonas aeruginosa]
MKPSDSAPPATPVAGPRAGRSPSRSFRARPTSILMPVARPSCVTCWLQDRGSCHGLRLTGGSRPGVNPPRPCAASRESLVATVLSGPSANPGPQRLLSEDDAGWLVDRLIEGDRSPHEPRPRCFSRLARRL